MILGFQSLVREIVMDSVTLVVLCELDLHGTVKGIFWRKLEKMVALVHCLLGNHFFTSLKCECFSIGSRL